MGGNEFYAVEYPVNGSLQELTSLKIKLPAGVLTEVVIDFPEGCQYLTHVRVVRGVMSIFPRNQGAFYTYNGYTHTINDVWILEKGAESLILEGYNLDETYPHRIRYAFNVVDSEIYFASLGMLERFDEFLSLQRQFLGVSP